MNSVQCKIISEECGYSFKDLYVAAFGHEPSGAELAGLYALSQEERNRTVARWAAKAGWGTKNRLGTDGVHYTAFCPLWKTGALKK